MMDKIRLGSHGVLSYLLLCLKALAGDYFYQPLRLRGRSRILLVLIAALGVCASQTGGGTELVGVVTDPTGASLPKARVMLIDLQSLETQRVEVPADGKFAFRKLKPGDYAVVVVGPTGRWAPKCWQPAIRQIAVTNAGSSSIRVPLLLDVNKCPEVVE